ncbi:MAG: zinc-ribbon and DUF3426 domain-containing protein [Granulosicoccus sp.]
MALETDVIDEGSEGNPLEDNAANTAVGNPEQDFGVDHGLAQPQTRCANCQTVFEVSSELLASNDTRVRCGECLSIFDALINLRQDGPAIDDDGVLVDDDGNYVDVDGNYISAIADATADSTGLNDGTEDVRSDAGTMRGDASTLDVTYSDFDLFSGEASLPDVAYFDQTQDLSSLRFDEPDGDETFSDTLFAHDMTIKASEFDEQAAEQSPALEPSALDTKVDFVTDDLQRDPVVFAYRDPGALQADHESVPEPDVADDLKVVPEPADDVELASLSTSKTSGSWLMRVFIVLLIVVVSAGLYAYKSRDVLLQNPEIRPWAAKACSWVGCELRPLVSLAALKPMKRAVFAHPTIENALVIDLAFMNQAWFDQPYPVLEISLTDSLGGLVVRNNVTPAEYLDGWQSQDLFSAGERLDLSLTVEDPGQTATSFELKFR